MHERGILFDYKHYFLRMVVFLYYHLGENGFLILLGVITGLVTGIGAGVMKLGAGSLSGLAPLLRQHGLTAAALLLPAAGLVGAFLLARLLLRKHQATNLSWVIYDLQEQQPEMSWLETFSHIFTSAVTVGLGGSAGLETPSVLTGAAIGSKTGWLCRLSADKRGTLMVCGTAAGISAVFGSPIAGALFALEVVFPRQARRRLVPILLSSAGAAIIAEAIFGSGSMFKVPAAPWPMHSLPHFILLGIVSAFVGVYLIRLNYHFGEWLKKFLPNRWVRLGVGCAGLAGLLCLFPILAGDGYNFVQMLFSGADKNDLQQWNHGWNLLLLSGAVILLKVVATVFTLECGGDGGIFAPTMFTGAFTGLLVARLVTMVTGIQLSDANFVAAGMCGVFTAALRAPLTGIFLIVEITGDFMMMVPLMIVSGLSYFTARFFEPYSVYTKVLGERHLIDAVPLQQINRHMTIAPYLKTGFSRAEPSTSLAELKKLLKSAEIPYLPVLNADSKLLGIVMPDRLGEAADPSLTAKQLMMKPLLTLSPDDDVNKAKVCFEVYGLDYLPVLDHKRFAGFVPKTEFSPAAAPEPAAP
ncbi:MAG: chloride channel protein [Lentisphaeria bacterium]|nr:chloride channel protein [Lentisphaeria bacterium]